MRFPVATGHCVVYKVIILLYLPILFGTLRVPVNQSNIVVRSTYDYDYSIIPT